MEGQQVQDDSIKRKAEEFLPEIPQIEYWERLEASVTKLQEAVDQLKEEQQNQNSMVYKLLREQEEQGRELKELKRQKLSLEGPSTPQTKEASTSQIQGC